MYQQLGAYNRLNLYLQKAKYFRLKVYSMAVLLQAMQMIQGCSLGLETVSRRVLEKYRLVSVLAYNVSFTSLGRSDMRIVGLSLRFLFN